MPKASLLIAFCVIILGSVIGASQSGSSAVETVSFKGFSLDAQKQRDILSMDERFLGLSERYLSSRSGGVEEIVEAVRQLSLNLDSVNFFEFDSIFEVKSEAEIPVVNFVSSTKEAQSHIPDLSLSLSEGVSLNGGYRFDDGGAHSDFTKSLDEGAHEIRLGLTFALK